MLAGKVEIQKAALPEFVQTTLVRKASATELSFIPDNSVDYIFTDPPYGSKIQYLDLSVMWNSWLDLEVTQEDYELEAIEGGTRNKTRQGYDNLIEDSFREMLRVLKPGRWLSFVFAHKDPSYWHMILESAEKAGFEYIGAVSQSNDKITFKKNQRPFKTLNGELIITFRKVENPRPVVPLGEEVSIEQLVREAADEIIAQEKGATLEQINDAVIIRCLETGTLDILGTKYKDIIPLLAQYYDYDGQTRKYHSRPNTKLTNQISLSRRISYYLWSFLKRREAEGRLPSFDEVILSIMPLLKNGITPKQQTIEGVLAR